MLIDKNRWIIDIFIFCFDSNTIVLFAYTVALRILILIRLLIKNNTLDLIMKIEIEMIFVLTANEFIDVTIIDIKYTSSIERKFEEIHLIFILLNFWIVTSTIMSQNNFDTIYISLFIMTNLSNWFWKRKDTKTHWFEIINSISTSLHRKRLFVVIV